MVGQSLVVPSEVSQMVAVLLVVGQSLVVDQMAVDQIEHNTNPVPPSYITYYMHMSSKGEIYHIIALCLITIDMCLSNANPPISHQRI